MYLKAANGNDDSHGHAVSARSPRLLEWLQRLTQPGFTLDLLHEALVPAESAATSSPTHSVSTDGQDDNWLAVFHICGYSAADFNDAAAPLPLHLPLTVAEIEHFRRNHRGTEKHVGRDFRQAQSDLPSPLSELYGLYLYRTRLDIESTLVLAQSTHSTRVARAMADLLAMGGFANGMEYVSYLGVSYSVPAAFDTATSIDRANSEATRRLCLPADHPSHLLTLTSDALGVLAASITEKTILPPQEFLEKANKLAEARQDVNRLPIRQHFATAITENDLPLQTPWVARLALAFARHMPNWVVGLPEIQAMLG